MPMYLDIGQKHLAVLCSQAVGSGYMNPQRVKEDFLEEVFGKKMKGRCREPRPGVVYQIVKLGKVDFESNPQIDHVMIFFEVKDQVVFLKSKPSSLNKKEILNALKAVTRSI